MPPQVHVSSPITKSLYPISLPAARLTSLISFDKRALLKLSLANNFLATKSNATGAGQALAEMLKGNSVLKELDVSANAPSGYQVDGPAFAVAISQGLSDNGALTSLDISENDLWAEGTKLLAKALKSNQIMTALNISSNRMTSDGNGNLGDMSGVAALADAMPGMGASTKLIFGGDEDCSIEVGPDEYKQFEPATLELGMAEVNFSNKNLGITGAIIISAWLIHKDNGALTSLNISDNNLTNYGRDMSGKPREHVFGLLI
jgi:hypothetical protein